MRLPLYIALCLCLTGCGVFDPRTPEAPDSGGGTFLQPDTPERVAENLQNAIAELSDQNYIRSLAIDFAFEPTVSAAAREPLLWTDWGRAQEGTYFGRLKDAAAPFDGHSLELIDVTRTIVTDTRFVVDASYLLTVRHSRTDEGVPIEVQGRLIWEIVQGADGLWQLQRWTDQELGTEPSWSDLKAAFVK